MRYSSIFWTLVSTAIASPLAPPITGKCRSVALGVHALRAWKAPASSFCSSWLPITAAAPSVATVTAATSTITVDASTITATAPGVTTMAQQTITADTSTSYITSFTTTVTVVGDSSCRAEAQQKRQVGVNRTLPPNAPRALRAFARTYISSACQCLSLPTPIPAAATTTTITPLATHVPLTTVTTTRFDTITPSPATVIPSTTVIIETASTVTIPGLVLLNSTPGPVLPNPTPITGLDGNGLAVRNLDDETFRVELPFPISIFGEVSSTVNVDVNGYVRPPYNRRSQADNLALPSRAIQGTAYLPYWDDLYIKQGTRQGLYYSVYGEPGSRRVGFEWYTLHLFDENAIFHFVATFQEDEPNRVIFDYYEVSTSTIPDSILLGTVGAQRLLAAADTTAGTPAQYSFAQYSFDNSPPISAGLRLVFNSDTLSFTSNVCSKD